MGVTTEESRLGSQDNTEQSPKGETGSETSIEKSSVSRSSAQRSDRVSTLHQISGMEESDQTNTEQQCRNRRSIQTSTEDFFEYIDSIQKYTIHECASRRYTPTRSEQSSTRTDQSDASEKRMDVADKQNLEPWSPDAESMKSDRESSVDATRFYSTTDLNILVKKLSGMLDDGVELPYIFDETAHILKIATNSRGAIAYVVDSFKKEIYQYQRYIKCPRHKVNWRIGPGCIVAAHVAHTKELIVIDDILGDERFPMGIGIPGPEVKSILCVPIVTPNDKCISVIQLYREMYEDPYTKDNLQIVAAVAAWMGIAIYQNQQRLILKKQKELNDSLLQLTTSYFDDHVLIDNIVSQIVMFAKNALQAERGSFFIVDQKCDELVADLFDEGIDAKSGEGILHRKRGKIRFSKHRGIAGVVVNTGKLLNIHDAYSDPRFNKEVDLQTGYITNSILCMPVSGKDGILGVVQLVNKKNGECFNKNDEAMFKTFSVYCALALGYCRTSEQLIRTQLEYSITTDMFAIYLDPCRHDLDMLRQQYEKTPVPEKFRTFSWYLYGFEDDLEVLFLHMVHEVLGLDPFKLDNLMNFIMMVKKAYKPIPYHNFYHAFNVTHCMYNVLVRNRTVFTYLEKTALLFAAICHDLDHVGLSNSFLLATRHKFAQLYSTSTLENHHYDVALLLFKESKVFEDYSNERYKDLTREIYDAIIATDLQLYFSRKVQLRKLVVTNTLDWKNSNHRSLIKSILMTACDLSAQTKPFNIARRITEDVYEEFHNQGDREKEQGLCPVPMMDREKRDMIPDDQVTFLSVVCLPCARLLGDILPNTAPLENGCMKLLDSWEEIVKLKDCSLWRPSGSIVQPKGILRKSIKS